MANIKPLPPLPASSLSVEGQAHRTHLIKYFLHDIHDPGVETRRDGWLYVLEEVLDRLAVECSRGDWLGSLRRREEKRRIGKRSKETKGEKPLPPKPETPLQKLRKLAARPAPPKDEQRIGHLVLCVAPHGSLPLPAKDSGFEILPANIGCVFSPGSFALQDADPHEQNGTVMYGLSDELDDDNLRLIGGTFTFKGVNSPTQHHILRKVLRLAIYVHLSLILEQTVLLDSGIELKFGRPKFPSPSPSTPTRLVSDDSKPAKDGVYVNDNSRPRKHRNSIIPSSFTNFFLKRNFSYRRSQTISQPTTRGGGSLDLTVIPTSPLAEAAPRLSIEGAVNGLRLRRLSFLGDRRSSMRKSQSQPLHVETEQARQPFSLAVKRIEGSRGLLSTSPGVVFVIPKLVVELAEKEKVNVSQDGTLKRRLKGDERVALTSILGWDGKDAEGRGMSGILGFVRHQEISFLRSTHVPPSPASPDKTQPISQPESTQSSASGTASTFSMDSEVEDPSASTVALAIPSHLNPHAPNVPYNSLVSCAKPHWTTYRYFSFHGNEDFRLGGWVQDVAMNRRTPCSRLGCKFLQGQHEQRLIHDGVRIVIRLADIETNQNGKEKQTVQDEDDTNKDPTFDDDDIVMWKSCAVCHAKTSRTKMGDGTYSFSFAKYLELLVYSPSICTVTPSLCEHTTPPPIPYGTLPWSRFNIVWHFCSASTDISIALSPIEDIFELKVPRLQITRGADKPSPPPTGVQHSDEGQQQHENQQHENPQKKILRKEIKRWWECVSDHIDKIELVLDSDEPTQKSLPRLPSRDSAYDVFDASNTLPGPSTPRAFNSLPFPSVPPPTPNHASYFATHSTSSTNTETPAPTVPPKEIDDSEKLLVALRRNFQNVEQSLYIQLSKTPETSLNDVRRAFLATGLGSRNRLKAWQKKHLGTAKANLVGDLKADEPSWWNKSCHAVPACNIIVRENDWGSIIAHTLSTVDYQMELANISMVRTSSSSQASPSPSSPEATTSSFFSVASGYRLFTSSSKNQPDPDQEHVVWNEPEAYSAVISRKEIPRETTPLLAVLRSKNAPYQQNVPASATSSRFSSLPGINAPNAQNPPSVKTKPDIGLTIQAAGGKNTTEPKEHASKMLQELGQSASPALVPSSRPPSVISEYIAPVALEDRPSDVKPPSVISLGDSDDSRKTIGKDDVIVDKDLVDDAAQGQASQLPPPLPPKDFPKAPITENGGLNSTSTAPSAWNASNDPPGRDASSNTSSSRLASTLASGLNSAMRFVLKSEPSTRLSTPSGSAMKKQHHVLLCDIATPDGRPHIKYDWTIAKRLKFSCTVYYAKQFDVLRKRCGIQDVYLKSLSKSTDWVAEGGKSKSNFWKTSDDRFIIKTLVNAWNVSDLQVLLDFAPSYFRYMDATTSKPTVLCKILGFYTVEIRNLETGAVQSKSDLLVMENLFFDQKINKTFDLKGIQGRKVKSHGDTTKTLFDGEWIEGQQRTLTLVRPYSKVILRESIKSDVEFLAKSNIMDYSLLLGVDEQKKEIFCGLVDTIGSYTFAKTLEYKAKHGLQSGEVTVMPPTEYQERFVTALEGYFVACPDKWSKPEDESKVTSDPDLLPSVL